MIHPQGDTRAQDDARRLVILEGIMGSGKSTTARQLAARLSAAGMPARALTEATCPHPVRATDELEHWFQPWRDTTAQALALRAQQRWADFAQALQREAGTVVLDGQLFHGDFTHLFLMELQEDALAAHVDAVARSIAPLRPLLVYFRQPDVPAAIARVCAQRGEDWLAYQTGWKLAFPWARARGLEGMEGLVAVYVAYRALTDRLFERVALDKLALDTTAPDWPACVEAIVQAVDPRLR